MDKYKLNEKLSAHYLVNREAIINRLEEFKQVKVEDYFYEFCFCICTPQSKAAHALIVQKELEVRDFRNTEFDPKEILQRKSNYIRFHNQKSARLLKAREQFPEIQKWLLEDAAPRDKRNRLANEFVGIGMKEASHFLRNIGYRDLAILDRHILRHLTEHGVYNEIPNISSFKKYIVAENAFEEFSLQVGISMDELDLLFWSASAGEIIK